MISKDDVKHIAYLARLGITEEEIEKFQRDLGAILDYVKELEGANTENVEPTSHVTGAENVMRDDDISEKHKVKSEKLIEMAPETKDGYVKTKAIF